MAGGNLTAREFWQLSPEERLKRCGELSEHEAYVARITDPCIEKNPIYVPCNDCIHNFRTELACKAHPDGMTQETIAAVVEDHNFECGNGYKFTKKE